ncbi:hypothetical protein ARMGADRAFT_871784, partial [Armillaria gallica]
YPPSPPFEEAGPTSSVSHAYLDESLNYDTAMLQDQRGEVNILLVFVSSSSQIRVTFFNYYQEMSAVLLFDQINIQRALANGTSLADITTSGIDPTAAFTPDSGAVVIYAFWLASLTLSLATAFFAILVDALYCHYVSPIAGQPKVHARTQHLHYKGLIKSRLRTGISFLQLLFHLSLVSFVLGLAF